MNEDNRLPAFIAYLLPVVGWAYVWFFERKNRLAIFHLKQSIGLALFLLVCFAVWAVIGWILAWVPYLGLLSMALFSLVIAAYLFGAVVWVIGMSNALRGKVAYLPLFGRNVHRMFH